MTEKEVEDFVECCPLEDDEDTLEGNSELHLAVKNNDITEVKRLLAVQGTDPNLRNRHGYTPFMWAVQNRFTDLALLVLRHPSVDCNLRYPNGMTALHVAILNLDEELLTELLARRDVDCNLRDEEGGHTPLHLAIKRRLVSSVGRLLARHDLDVNLKDRHGQTALIMSAEFGQPEIFLLILEHPCLDYNHQDNLGNCALHYTVLNNMEASVKALLQKEGVNKELINFGGANSAVTGHAAGGLDLGEKEEEEEEEEEVEEEDSSWTFVDGESLSLEVSQ